MTGGGGDPNLWATFKAVTNVDVSGYSVTNASNVSVARASGFNPLSSGISNLALWLDAADQSTMSLTGSSVNSWTDKASNIVFTAQGTAPTLSGSNIAFGGSSYLLNNSFVYTIPNHTSFIVMGETGGHSNTAGILAFGTSTDYASSNAKTYNTGYMNPNGNNFVSECLSLSGGYTMGNAATGNTGAPFSVWNDQYTSGSGLMFRNGSQISSTSVALSLSNSTALAIGARNQGGYNQFLRGVIAEVVLYTRVLTTNERQRIEGYLAWKWGLQASLPGSHPYSSAAPTGGLLPVGTMTTDASYNLQFTTNSNIRLTAPTEYRWITSNVSGTSLTLASNSFSTFYRLTNTGFNLLTVPTLTSNDRGAFWSLSNATASNFTMTISGGINVCICIEYLDAAVLGWDFQLYEIRWGPIALGSLQTSYKCGHVWVESQQCRHRNNWNYDTL
jgi:hypothetical protein